MKPSEFFKLLRNGIVGKTAAANVGDIINIMSQEAEKGNDILYISFLLECQAAIKLQCWQRT